MRLLRWLAALVLGAALPLLAAGQTGLSRSTPAVDLGVHDGRLKPPSTTPNSVSSQAVLHPDHPQRAYAQIDPLPATDGDPRATTAGTSSSRHAG